MAEECAVHIVLRSVWPSQALVTYFLSWFHYVASRVMIRNPEEFLKSKNMEIKKTIRKFFFPVLSVILMVVDIVSDMVLGVDYCVAGNKWWCGLTLAFIDISLTMYIFVCFVVDQYKSFNERVWIIKILIGIEVCFESGPQFLLQLYIIALSEIENVSTSGKT